jgi:prepilin-type processing-associated H-X9-DG protein
MLLPYLDQRDLYNAINFEHPASQGDDFSNPWHPGPPYFGQFVNTTAYFRPVQVFLCPSDSIQNNPGHKSVGVTSYAGNYSSGYQVRGSDGVMFWSDQGLVRMSDIIDGASHTAAMSEWIRGDDDAKTLSPKTDVFHLPTNLSQPSQFEQFVDACRSLQPDQSYVGGFQHWSYRGEYWILGDVGRTLYNHVLPPNSISCTQRGKVFGDFLRGALGASSQHSGGVHVLACDGSVRFIGDSIDLAIWRALATRAGGEALPENPF